MLDESQQVRLGVEAFQDRKSAAGCASNSVADDRTITTTRIESVIGLHMFEGNICLRNSFVGVKHQGRKIVENVSTPWLRS